MTTLLNPLFPQHPLGRFVHFRANTWVYFKTQHKLKTYGQFTTCNLKTEMLKEANKKDPLENLTFQLLNQFTIRLIHPALSTSNLRRLCDVHGWKSLTFNGFCYITVMSKVG